MPWRRPRTEILAQLRDDLAAIAGAARLCFVGSADQITCDERWGGVRVDLAGPVVSRRAELEALGWEVRVPATPRPRLRSGREVKSVQDAVAASA